MSSSARFRRLVTDAMTRRGLGLRELCRAARLDPSFLSKVLAGKRNPPSDEDDLRRLAEALGADPVELCVAAGRLPAEWAGLGDDSMLLARVDALARGARPAARAWRREAPPAAPARPAPVPRPAPARGFSEELL